MTKIPLKPQNDQNTPKTQQMTKIPLETKKLPKYPQNPNNDQNTLETQKMTKIPIGNFERLGVFASF